MPTITDYVIIAVACVGIAFIIGMCIVSVVDKKMSDIVINVPKPEVTVNVNGDCKKEENTVEDFTPTDNKSQTVSTEIKPTEVKKTSTIPKKTTLKSNKKRPIFLNMYEGDDELYPDVEGTRQYAVMGCQDRNKKMKLYPNQVACNVPNYLTAENYYVKNFEYPVAPGQSEERHLGADFDEANYLAKADQSIRIISRNKNRLSTKPPFPANYWFK